MSEESRLGREQLEVGYALKQIISAGVRVFFYLEDRERTLDTPIDKIMLSLTAFADELEREKASQRTYDAMLRKARAGHVTGGAGVRVRQRRTGGARWPPLACRQAHQRPGGVNRPPDLRHVRERKWLHADLEGPERRRRALPAAAAGSAVGLDTVIRSRDPQTAAVRRFDPLEPNQEAEPVGRAQAVDTPKQRVDDHPRAAAPGRVGRRVGRRARASAASRRNSSRLPGSRLAADVGT